MKTWCLFFVLAVIAPTVAPVSGGEPVAGKPPTPPPLSPRFKQVRDRIDALFGHRNEPPQLPDARQNPFRPPGAAIDPKTAVVPSDAATITTPVPDIPSSDLTRLQEGVATLKVSGSYEKEGRVYLVINMKSYTDNGVIQTQVHGETVYLRIRQVSRRGMTVVLNDAEMTLKF